MGYLESFLRPQQHRSWEMVAKRAIEAGYTLKLPKLWLNKHLEISTASAHNQFLIFVGLGR